MTELFVTNTSARAVGLALVEFLWQGALIGVLTVAALTMLRSASSQARYLVACVGLLSMLAAPAATVIRQQYGASSPISFFSLQSARAGLTASSSRLHNELPGPQASSSEWTRGVDSWLPAILGLWIGGVAFLSLRLIRDWLAVETLRRSAVDQVPESWVAKLQTIRRALGIVGPVRIAQSLSVRVPTVVGWMRPLILLPASAFAGLSPFQFEAILAHELAHIRRHDYLVNIAQNVVETLLFYHPAVWWVSKRVRVEREHCCDEVAVAFCGDRVAYAGALANLEDLRSRSLTLAMPATGGHLLARIQRVLRTPSQADGRSTVWAFVVIALALVVTPIAGTPEGRAAGPSERPRDTAREVLRVHAAPLRVDQAVEARVARPAAAPASSPAGAAARRPSPQSAPAAQTDQAAPPPSPIRVGGAIREPKLLERVQPAYPAAARAAGVQGYVILEATIDADGRVADAKVIKPSGSDDLDRAAVDAVSAWRYMPTLLNGVAVPVLLNVAVTFSLTRADQPAVDSPLPSAGGGIRTLLGGTPEAAAHLAPPAGTAPDPSGPVPVRIGDETARPTAIRVTGQMAAPRLIRRISPAYPPAARAAGVQGAVILEATIDAEGNVVNTKVLEGVTDLDQAAINAVAQWKYTPTLLNGVPVAIILQITINFSLQ